MGLKMVVSYSLWGVILLNVMCYSGLAQPAGPPESQCTSSLLSLLNCEPFLQGSNVSTPPESCCAGLNDLVRSAPTCLCGVISGSPDFWSINLTRASELPDKCGIPVDKSQCGALSAPPPSPQKHPSPDFPGILSPPGSKASKLLASISMTCSWAVLSSISVLVGTGTFSH